MVIHRGIFKNNQLMLFPCFTFIYLKQGSDFTVKLRAYKRGAEDEWAMRHFLTKQGNPTLVNLRFFTGNELLNDGESKVDSSTSEWVKNPEIVFRDVIWFLNPLRGWIYFVYYGVLISIQNLDGLSSLNFGSGKFLRIHRSGRVIFLTICFYPSNNMYPSSQHVAWRKLKKHE